MTTGEPVRKRLAARRFQHLCPTHGWETCSGWGGQAVHICSKTPREVPPTMADLFHAPVREVFLDGQEPVEVQGP